MTKTGHSKAPDNRPGHKRYKNRPWCVDPFDPSLYEWKPTKEELKRHLVALNNYLEEEMGK